jgi:hypothetical protein
MASRIFSIARSLLHPPSVAVEPFYFEIHHPKRSAIVRSRKRASGGMADALASGASPRKGVGVQVPSRARKVRVISGILLIPLQPGEVMEPFYLIFVLIGIGAALLVFGKNKKY